MSGWPHGVRGACQLASLYFAAVVSAGIARSAEGFIVAPPRPPRPPLCPRADGGGAAFAPAPCAFCAASEISEAATMAPLATHPVMIRFIRDLPPGPVPPKRNQRGATAEEYLNGLR